jgi:N-acetylmuramoyl-L-alanine amidase
MHAPGEPGVFCRDTEEAVSRFQEGRGLRADGVCDHTTWAALVEAGYRLGDRLLVLKSPNLRGDDVADLQTRLCRLGFDAGRIDGIFGWATAHALEEFQRNTDMPVDGVCGPETILMLDRLGGRTGDGPGVAAVRELERLRDARRTLTDCRIVVGQFGGLSSIARATSHQLRHAGAVVMSVDEPDAVAQARAANGFGADVYVGLDADAADTVRIAYYAVPTFESLGGRSLAEHVADELARVWPAGQLRVVGMRLPVLRETKMPAVLCTLAPVREAVERAPDVARALLESLTAWRAQPLGRLDGV